MVSASFSCKTGIKAFFRRGQYDPGSRTMQVNIARKPRNIQRNKDSYLGELGALAVEIIRIGNPETSRAEVAP
jgi:hypothetical protein